ncbi:MAG: nucleoside-diphosphate sugar epimerase/dehydratase [Planctomycetota bacterium]|nr:nucleoside-diphosphate sugar epimerase/dehydratase [Planctomycetota bacterium]
MHLNARRRERIAITALDASVFAAAFWMAVAIRYGTLTPPIETIWALFAAPLVGVICLLPFRFYHEVLRYVGPNVLYRCGMGVSLTTLVLLSTSFLRSDQPSISRLVFLPFWMGSILGLTGVRLAGRYILQRTLGAISGLEKRRVLIYGAGQAGVGLSSMLGQDGSILVQCFVDDDRRLTGRDIRGIQVRHPESIGKLIKKYDINTVMLALPSASRKRRREVIEQLQDFKVEILTVPDMQELDSGLATFTDLRPINIEDLLGRESVHPDAELLGSKIKGRVVLVTGAGGSIGSELCRQIVHLAPARLILVENSEFNLYQIDAELSALASSGVTIVPILGNVCDGLQMRQVMTTYMVDTVYHAAAYKHVPIVEVNAIVGVANNVLGTLRTAEAAKDAKVRDFVLVSTDKAVRPTSVMGASKRMAELVLQAIHEDGTPNETTQFCMVRFGNVLGSSGSAVPKFTEQIEAGGPVTVTHPDVTRFFMTIHEAANLVIQAGSLAKGGDVFVLDMGQPVRIIDLATRMVELSGSSVRSETNPSGDIEMKFTGLRPGEKLYEELLIEGDLEATDHPKIMRSAEAFELWEDLSKTLQRLEAAIDRRDEETVLQILQQNVSGYRDRANISTTKTRTTTI